MAAYYISVLEVHPDGDISKNSHTYVYGPKQCLTVGEANKILKEKRDEYLATPKGKIQYQVSREHY